MPESPESKPTVTIKPASYQPRKAEMEEDMSVPVDPETLGKMVVADRKVVVEGEDS